MGDPFRLKPVHTVVVLPHLDVVITVATSHIEEWPVSLDRV